MLLSMIASKLQMQNRFISEQSSWLKASTSCSIMLEFACEIDKDSGFLDDEELDFSFIEED